MQYDIGRETVNYEWTSWPLEKGGLLLAFEAAKESLKQLSVLSIAPWAVVKVSN